MSPSKFIKSSLIILFFVLPGVGFAQTENIDPAIMSKIRNEGLENSKVMAIAFHITDLSGPRVTNSPGFTRAADYAINEFTQWGLVNAKLDPWGDFGKGWEVEKSYVAILSPWYRSLIAYPKTWTAGTNGLQKGQLLLISAEDSVGLDSYRGKLKGKILILDNLVEYQQNFGPAAKRFNDEELQKMSDATMAERPATFKKIDEDERKKRADARGMLTTLKTLAIKEGAIAMVTSAPRNYYGTVLVLQGGSYKIGDPANFLDIAIGIEDYNTMVRLLRVNSPIEMELEVKTKFYSDDSKGYNVIAEIPGTDKDLKEEIVMLGAHLDSWPAATGATDNAAGVCVMMEAVRILKAIGIKPKRTIRIALWSGEEQGLLGSRGYVKKTFADPATMKLQPAHKNFYVYFNLDNGSGTIRGIHLQGNEAARNIFQQWFAPFNDLGAKTVTITNTGSTDHISFDAVGLPGFQFIQDPVVSEHSNMDSYDHLMPNDLKQSATIMAAFVYNAAMRDAKFPRKALPKALSIDPISGSRK